jgi:hypothetical protein
MTTYKLFVPRSTAVMYAAWEYGLAGAAKFVNACPTDQMGRVDVSGSVGLTVWDRRRRRYGLPTKKAACNALTKVLAVAAFQEGRTGRPLMMGAGIAEIVHD